MTSLYTVCKVNAGRQSYYTNDDEHGLGFYGNSRLDAYGLTLSEAEALASRCNANADRSRVGFKVVPL